MGPVCTYRMVFGNLDWALPLPHNFLQKDGSRTNLWHSLLRRAKNESARWEPSCTRTTPTPPWPLSCISALSTIVKWMPLFFERLNCTSNNRHHKLHLQAKIDSNRPILIELWPCAFWLQNTPSQYLTSTGHNSMNIGPLPSNFVQKWRSWCRLLSVQSKSARKKKERITAPYSGMPWLHS